MDYKVIEQFESKELKKEIIAEYIKFLINQIAMYKRILSPENDWATTDSEYHKKCRRDMEYDIKIMEGQIKLLR